MVCGLVIKLAIVLIEQIIKARLGRAAFHVLHHFLLNSLD